MLLEIATMEVFGKSTANVIYLSTILGQDGPNPNPCPAVHKCDWKCENDHVLGNIYRCNLTGRTHICDRNCDQRIVYDNHSSLCRVSKQIFPLTPVEQQAVKGVRRKPEAESCSSADNSSFGLKRHCNPSSPIFERSPFGGVVVAASQIGDGMDIN